jgi:PAS domain S-box-containing protein
MTASDSPDPLTRHNARSERTRFLLPLLAAALVFGTIGAISYAYLSELIRSETHRTLAIIVEQKRQQVEDIVAEARIDAELYFTGHSQLEILLAQWLAGGRRDQQLLKLMQTSMEEVGQVRHWAGLVVADTRARPIFSFGTADLQAHSALVQDILQRPRIELVDLHLDAQGQASYGVLAPIGPAGEAPLGIAYLSGRADQSLYPLVGAWPVPTQTAETYLVRREGQQVRFLTPLRHLPDAALTLSRSLQSPHLPAAMAAQGQQGILSGGRDYRGAAVLAYAAPVAGTPWLMIAEMDEAEAYANIHTLAWITGVLTGLGLLLVYSAVYQFWRRDREHKEFQALRSLQAAEARFRVVFEQAPLGVALIDSHNNRILEANPRFAEIVGRMPEDLSGLNAQRITHPDDIAASSAKLAQLKQGHSHDYSLVKRYLRPDGNIVWINETGATLQTQADEAPRHMIIVEDISERREMEERLQISEARHRLLADNAIDVISTMDLDGRYTYISPSVSRTRGFTQQEVMRQTVRESVTPESAQRAFAYFEKLRADIAAGRPLESFRAELEYLHKDGSTLWCEATGSPLLDRDGKFIEILGVTRDISERRHYEAELRQVYDAAEAANAAKSEFLAHMSHEIRTPMNAVLGLAQVLERESLGDKQRDMVQRIRQAGQSLLTILNDVLDLSKIEAGQLRIESRAFDLPRLLANLDSLMGQAARDKGITLRVVTPALPPGTLSGDGLRLEQVLLNLIGNAIKFTERGEVALVVSPCESSTDSLRLRFEVRDTGIGIAPAALAGLFAPFTQADAGISRRYGGTGLGLSICKRLVELMGGVIGVESQPGLGSTFWFELPFQRGAQAQAEATTAPALPSGPRLGGAHVLVVDDSAMNRDLVERALALEGAITTLAADGQQAVQLLESRPDAFDAVLMDVQMPVMDGLSAIRIIRGRLGLTALPVIAFTAGVRDEQQAAARDAGADDILPKPMDLDEMVALLARWIRPQADTPADSAAPAAATDDDFPVIAGIERESVMRRLGGDREMFLSLLQMFFEDNGEIVAQVREALAAGQREEAGRRMHTLASNAGFICADALMQAARQLEAAIDRGDTQIDDALALLDAQIKELAAASAAWR